MIEVAIWIAGKPRRSQKEIFAELADKFPEAKAAMKLFRKPFDVEDEETSKKIQQAYEAMREADTQLLMKPVAVYVQDQGYAATTHGSLPSITAKLPKHVISKLNKRSDVGRLFLIEGEGQLLLDSAVSTSRVPTVWQRGINGSGRSIAILETDNVDFTSSSADCPSSTNNCFLHPGLTRSGILSLTVDHGTLVASVAASNHSTYKGVAPGATIHSAGMTANDETALVDALNWALTSAPAGVNADVVNVSWGQGFQQGMRWSDWALDYWARDRFRIIVAAAGNEGQCNNFFQPLYLCSPAKAWNILSVGAYSDFNNSNWSDDYMWNSSSYVNPSGDREKPEVVAPGVYILGIGLDGQLIPDLRNGTSFSAPQVSGLAALLIQRKTLLRTSPMATRAIIMASAVHNISGDPRLSDLDGAGGVDAALADTIAATFWISHTAPCVRPCWWNIDIDDSNFPPATYLNQYFMASRGERVRVAIAWWSNADCPSESSCNFDRLDTDLDLVVFDPDGTQVAPSISYDNNYELVDMIAPKTGQYRIGIYKTRADETSNELGIAWVKDATYLPDLRNKDSWVSSLYVRNDGPVARTGSSEVKIQYFTSNGQPTIQESYPLEHDQWQWIPVNGNNRIPANDTGSAIVGGGEDVSVVVVNRAQPTAPRAGYAYSGQPLLNAPATTLYVPETLDLVNWQMDMPVFNTGQFATDITVQFFNSNGGALPPQTNANIPGNWQSSEFPLGDLDPNNNYFRSGRVSASQPVAAVAQAYEYNNTGRRLGYWATSSPATPVVWLPFAMTRLDNGWGATVWVQNTTGTPSSVSLDFFKEGSRDVYKTTGAVPLPANGMTSFNLRTNHYGLGWGWFGSAQVFSPVPIAVIVNQLNDGSNLGASYEGIPASAGSKSVILPYVGRGDGGCFYSNFTVRNLGSSDAWIEIKYFYNSGWPAETSYDNVVSQRVYNLYSATPVGQFFPTPPFAGSVVINSPQPIAVTTNVLNYCGGDDTVSYTGVPR